VIENLSRRGTADAYPAPLRNAPNAALLIDFDNVTMGIRSDFQLQLKRLLNSDVFKSKISVQRAYADWRRYPQYIVPLSESSIDLIFAPAFGSNKKNATDIRLAIDALELVFTRPEIGTFILLSGDSDFSSLVLKLKEYGKYVIGVGIRESSSDLLIQNCDEYYSYNEFTGLLKEGELEHRHRDPWALVVEAATRMQRADDVMRSDRLKQVMQDLDPDFSEKDAGFSKYSKFLQETARRGLLRLNKLDNGQYEIQLGSNANVPLEVERQAEAPTDTPAESPPPRRRGERGRGRSGGRSPASEQGLSLSQAFALLRQALSDIGAVGEESTDVEQTREKMRELGEREDQLFESRRFQRFLRQAHDAGVIDLAKTEDGAHLLTLRPEVAAAEGEGTPATGNGEGSGDERRVRRRGERGGRSRRGRRQREDESPEPAQPETPQPEAPQPEPAPVEAAAPPARGRSRGEKSSEREQKPSAGAEKSSSGRRNPRFRRGSRGSGVSAGAAPAGAEQSEAGTRQDEPAVAGPVTHSRSLRGRHGRRAAPSSAPGGAAADAPPAVAVEARSETAASSRSPEPSPTSAPVVAPSSAPAPRPDAIRAEAGADRNAEAEASDVASGGLLKRMSAALQRAMLGQAKDEEREDG